MKRQLVCALAAAAAFAVAGQARAQVVINEISSDSFNTPSTDYFEFIELFNTAGTATSLNGMTLVLFNGNGDVSYAAIDLDGFSTNANGFFVLGSNAVPGADNTTLLGAGNILQNGPDAVALYFGDATSFPNGTAATTANLIDAIVYGTDDADDTGLLAALGETTQYNEGPNPASDAADVSLARIPDGSGDFFQASPTPGAINAVPEPSTLALAGVAAGGLALARRRARRPASARPSDPA
jgi:hypothetical protein